MKALLVTSPEKKKNNFWTCSVTSPIGSMMPPCDLASIAAVLRENGITPEILELRISKDPMLTLQKKVEEWKPDALITNMATATAMEDYEILKNTRENVEKRICFGFHAMALPEEMFEMGATHVLMGDPEYSIVDVMNGHDTGRGICTKSHRTSESGWIENLDNLPYQALDLLDLNVYHTLTIGRERFSVLLANRGCPHQCTYCVIPFLMGGRPRMMSVDRVISEMEWNVNELGIRSFFFIDSMLNLQMSWIFEFCEEILRRNLKIQWCCNMRVAPITSELMNLMKRAGCFRVFYGVEDLDLIDQLKRKTTREKTKEAFVLAKDAGIEAVAFIILVDGFDSSEKEMAKRMLRMVKEIKVDALQCNLAIPYPGSEMYTEYLNKYVMSDDWSLYDPAGNKLPYPSQLDLVKVRRMVYLGFFMRNPRYVWNTVKKADPRSLFSFLINSLEVLRGKY